MDFHPCIKSCVAEPDDGCHWYDQLCSESKLTGELGAYALRTNIERTTLFTTNPAHIGHVQVFCKTLSEIPAGTAVERAKQAIKQSGTMVSVGPNANSPEGGVCALILFSSFLKRYVNRSIRGPIDPTSDPDFDSAIWSALDDKKKYPSLIKPTEAYRGELPNRFWTALEDINTLESAGTVSVARLRKYLGLTPADKPAILVQITTGKEPPFFVPTGWDGFTNMHFRENTHYDKGDSSTHFGYTLDLQSSPEIRGARELVAPPVLAVNTHFVRKYK